MPNRVSVHKSVGESAAIVIDLDGIEGMTRLQYLTEGTTIALMLYGTLPRGTFDAMLLTLMALDRGTLVLKF